MRTKLRHGTNLASSDQLGLDVTTPGCLRGGPRHRASPAPLHCISTALIQGRVNIKRSQMPRNTLRTLSEELPREDNNYNCVPDCEEQASTGVEHCLVSSIVARFALPCLMLMMCGGFGMAVTSYPGEFAIWRSPSINKHRSARAGQTHLTISLPVAHIRMENWVGPGKFGLGPACPPHQ